MSILTTNAKYLEAELLTLCDKVEVIMIDAEVEDRSTELKQSLQVSFNEMSVVGFFHYV